jgi:hypothetical protein
MPAMVLLAVAIPELQNIGAQQGTATSAIWMLRADSGFAREALMAWCEINQVDFVFGLARNSPLAAMITEELAAAKAASQRPASRRAAGKIRPRATVGAEQGKKEFPSTETAVMREPANERGFRSAKPSSRKPGHRWAWTRTLLALAIPEPSTGTP